jgi:cell shape-determining protein MreD
MTKYFKLALQIFLSYCLIVLQFTFISSVNVPFNLINLPLILLILIVILGRKNYYLYFAFLIGFIFDIFSFDIFSIYIISFLSTAITSRYLQLSFFTNRSIYSFIAITAFATIMFNFTYQIINFIINVYQSSDIIFLTQAWFWQALSYKLILHSIIIVLLFYVIKFTSRRLRPYLLARK